MVQGEVLQRLVIVSQQQLLLIVQSNVHQTDDKNRMNSKIIFFPWLFWPGWFFLISHDCLLNLALLIWFYIIMPRHGLNLSPSKTKISDYNSLRVFPDKLHSQRNTIFTSVKVNLMINVFILIQLRVFLMLWSVTSVWGHLSQLDNSSQQKISCGISHTFLSLILISCITHIITITIMVNIAPLNV